MASLTLNILSEDTHTNIFIFGVSITLLIGIVYALALNKKSSVKSDSPEPNEIVSFLRFFYASFLKPHTGDDTGNGQQDALESFYKAQAAVYDKTRKRLLRGREDMLGLVAAQLIQKAEGNRQAGEKRIWVDIGGGTGWNIEAMSEFVSVPEFFSSVYLVDFSPSLCEVARKRFARLGWKNVKVVCQDARTFRLEDHEGSTGKELAFPREPAIDYFVDGQGSVGGAELITLSYSLSMIPDFYSVIDSLTNLLAPAGVMGVVDFYVQSIVDLSFRNYTGGALSRHVNWFGRLFWRAWFDVDRVGLEAARRDYLEYRFGTVLGANYRNYPLGAIPYYVWIGCQKKPAVGGSSEIVERLDAVASESPYLYPINHTKAVSQKVERSAPEIRSKAFNAAVVNLAANLPLPSFFYQNHHWRIHYDETLKKHTQFKNEYIYAFTWEDARVDQRLLKLTSYDVVLAITSAGDNILSYALDGPARIHAVDLNPSQNHLLELKVAAFTALSYSDFWKIFGLGKHADFRSLLISKLSPHLSSRAFQYWMDNTNVFASKNGKGLYETGGSRHAIRTVRILFSLLGLQSEVKALLSAKTMNEQREIYYTKIRNVLLSRILSYCVVSTDKFLWAALGVPSNQVAMLEADHASSESLPGTVVAAGDDAAIPAAASNATHSRNRGAAVWEYMVQTLDPVVENTLVGEDNPYYLVTLQGSYSQRCHPAYLSPKAHQRLSRAAAFEGLRIHTDEIDEVLARLAPGTLTIAVLMDSMDWFDPGAAAAGRQIAKLNKALKLGGRVMVRSAALRPWYVAGFEAGGFRAKNVGSRIAGACIDRVNMYASCWIMTKIEDLHPLTPSSAAAQFSGKSGSIDLGEKFEL